jgi:hypothetical protein
VIAPFIGYLARLGIPINKSTSTNEADCLYRKSSPQERMFIPHLKREQLVKATQGKTNPK